MMESSWSRFYYGNKCCVRSWVSLRGLLSILVYYVPMISATARNHSDSQDLGTLETRPSRKGASDYKNESGLVIVLPSFVLGYLEVRFIYDVMMGLVCQEVKTKEVS
jgi:hypothetical protein